MLGSIEFHDLDVLVYDSLPTDLAAPSPFPNHLVPHVRDLRRSGARPAGRALGIKKTRKKLKSTIIERAV
jgi:cis-zeatin O-glucosyltransferase